MKVLITCGAGFVGSAVVRQFISDTHHHIVNFGKLTSSATFALLSKVAFIPSSLCKLLGTRGFAVF